MDPPPPEPPLPPPEPPPPEPPQQSMLDEPAAVKPVEPAKEEEKAKFGGFMPAALRVKRQAHQNAQKAKMRRTASAEDVSAVKDKEPEAVAAPAAPAAPVVKAVHKPAPPAMQHTVPARECRSADELYNNLKAIQEGRHGVVYKAKDKNTGEVVALKNMKNEKDRDAGGFSTVFMREVNILFEIQHPNIVTLREVVHVSQEDDEECEDANWFLVMEFVPHDLKDIITTMKTPFSEAQVKHLMVQLIGAVAALHEAWVVHRDLKTANLLLDSRGTLKVCDLGMARSFGEGRKPVRNFTEEVISRWYRPPEIIVGKKDYTENVDVWSIGCIFGELLQRAVLLPGESEIDQLHKTWALIGSPTPATWPEYSGLIAAKNMTFKTSASSLRAKFPKVGYDPDYVHGENCKTTSLSDAGLSLFGQLLMCNPAKRPSAAECLDHNYFCESPSAEPLSEELLVELHQGKAAALAKAKEDAKRAHTLKQQQANAAKMGLQPSFFGAGGGFSGTAAPILGGANQSMLLQQMLTQGRLQQMQQMNMMSGQQMNMNMMGGMNMMGMGMANPMMAQIQAGTCIRCRQLLALCKCNK